METVTILKTGGVVIGGTTVVGATGYGAYSLIQPKNIRDQLIWDKFELLGEDSELWSQLVTKYESDSEKLNGNLTQSTNDLKKKELYNKCKEILKTLLTDEEANNKMSKAKRWCIKNPEALKNG